MSGIGSWNFKVVYSVEMHKVSSVSMHCTVLGAAIGFVAFYTLEGK
jgi:hypothetical protein